MEIVLTLNQLEDLLYQQKKNVIEKLLGSSYYYNANNTPGHLNSLPINEEKFKEIGYQATYPNDFYVLKKYIKHE